jgi:uncharacterized protein (TIRG00374 family)
MGIGRRHARLVCQAVVSAVLIVWLLRIAPQQELIKAWHAVGWRTLLAACACYVVATLLSVHRWQLLLRNVNIKEDAVRLTEVYFIGLFCSLFLPTSAGGDAYRVFELARRGHSAARTLLATLQDRLLGLGATMLVGVVAVFWYADRLPANLCWAVLAAYGLGIIAVALVLHQKILIRLMGGWQLPGRWLQWRPLLRVVEFLRPLQAAPALNWWRTVRVVGLALGTFAMAVLMYAVVCNSVEADCGFLALALIVSLVGVVRMMPIAFGGAGVGEEAFVFLAGLFSIANGNATVVALVILGVGTAMSLLGGLLLLRRKWFARSAVPAFEHAEPVLLPLAAVSIEQGGGQRHAA